MNPSAPSPGADERRSDLIVTWHAQGHDALDAYGIPRDADGLWYTLAERVDLLAAKAGIERSPRRHEPLKGAGDA